MLKKKKEGRRREKANIEHSAARVWCSVARQEGGSAGRWNRARC